MLIEIETAAFADATAKAARVAPTKGAAFDKAAGLMLEFDPHSPDRPVTVKSTDLESTFLTRLPAQKGSGDASAWRLPAGLLAGFLSQLPMGPGSTVTLSDKQDKISLKSGRTRANIHTIDASSFPRFAWFDGSELKAVSNLAQCLQQVAWAVDSDGGTVIGGVHIDGKRLVACDRTKLAEIPCVVSIDDPITVPLQALAGTMRNTAEIKVRATDKRLLLMTDQDTQATSRIYAEPFPSLDSLRSRVEQNPHSIEVSVEAFSAVLKRQMVLCRGERYPSVKMTLGDGVISIEMDVPDLGTMEDEFDCKGGSLVSTVILFSPTLLVSALGAARTPIVTLTYDGPLHPVAVVDGAGYRCIAAPMRTS